MGDENEAALYSSDDDMENQGEQDPHQEEGYPRTLTRYNILRMIASTRKHPWVPLQENPRRKPIASCMAAYLRNIRTIHPDVDIHPMMEALWEHINQIQSLLVYNQPNYVEISAIGGPKNAQGIPTTVIPYSSIQANYVVNRAIGKLHFADRIRRFYEPEFIPRINMGLKKVFENYQNVLTNKEKRLRAEYDEVMKNSPSSYKMPIHAASFRAFELPILWFPSFVRFPEGIRIFSDTTYYIHRTYNANDYFAIHEKAEDVMRGKE